MVPVQPEEEETKESAESFMSLPLMYEKILWAGDNVNDMRKYSNQKVTLEQSMDDFCNANSSLSYDLNSYQ